MKRHAFVLAFAAVFAGGCTLGPDYTRPDLDMPESYRGTVTGEKARAFGDIAWVGLFQDPEMEAVIRDAVARNLDLKIALLRIEAAQSQLTNARSRLLPNVDGSLSSSPAAGAGSNDTAYALGLVLSWELDLFGKLRRANEAARAEMLASEDVARAVMSTVVATTASAWLTLRELDQEVRITRANIRTQEESLDLVRSLMQGGVVSGAEEQQAITQLANTRARLPQLEQAVIATENSLSLLLGQAPGTIARSADAPLLQPPALPDPGLPSELLERRPDVRAAEQALHAATARVGVAIANRFPVPTLGLGGFFGRTGVDLGDVFDNSGSTAEVESWGPNASLPLLDWGRGVYGVRGARATAQAAAHDYRFTVLNALAEVSNAMVSTELGGQVVAQSQISADAAVEALRLQDMRFRAGASSYLEVLDAQRQQYGAEIALAQARQRHLLAHVELYRALGGGWSDEALAQVERGHIADDGN
jgi:multidrug efflux system outer membrane protein